MYVTHGHRAGTCMQTRVHAPSHAPTLLAWLRLITLHPNNKRKTASRKKEKKGGKEEEQTCTEVRLVVTLG